jgi:spermidine synthase
MAVCTTSLQERYFWEMFSGYSWEILIVLAFQIIYGYLYYKIGLIITSFMVGLGLGSSYMTRRLPKIIDSYKEYTVIQGIVLAYPLILLISFRVFSHLSSYLLGRSVGATFFAILPFVAGFVGGMQYPLANKICLREGGEVGQTAGATYAADLLGSFVGALLISAFFVPIVGIPLTCILVTALNATALAILLLARPA